MGVRNAPYSTLDDGYVAIDGEPVVIFDKPGTICKLSIGNTVTRGDLLKPSTDGIGIPVASDKDGYGARALQSGVSGDEIEVQIEKGFYAV